MSLRDKWQKEGIDKWWTTKKGTVCLPTGVGKTKVGVDIVKKMAEQNTNFSVLIVVPTVNLKENEWVNEFEKWYPSLPYFVDIECINTAYKFDKTYDLLIVDEIHKSLSPEFIKLYSNIKHKYLLGLTATEPSHREDYTQLLNQICPVVYHRSLKEAVEYGILTDFTIYNVGVKFTKKEQFLYKKFDKAFHDAKEAIHAISFKYGMQTDKTIFDIASEHRTKPDSLLFKAAKSFWSSMTLRKWVCYNAENKAQTCIDIIKEHPNRRWIIFSTSTKFVDALYERLDNAVKFHSKMKKKEKEAALETFAQDPSKKVLISAMALNQGYNLPNIDGAICASGTSVELTNIQQLGRSLRKASNKSDAIFVNLYVPDTQEEKWVRSKTGELFNYTIWYHGQNFRDLKNI